MYFINIITDQFHLGIAFLYGMFIVFPIIRFLFHHKKANVRDIDPFSGEKVTGRWKCGDSRCTHKTGVIFGGAAVFHFGLPYYFLSLGLEYIGVPYIPGILHFFVTYQFWVSVIMTAVLLTEMYEQKNVLTGKHFTLEAHLNECGMVTASGILFPFFWSQIFWPKKWITKLRDKETVINFWASIPSIALLSMLQKPFTGKNIRARIRYVHPFTPVEDLHYLHLGDITHVFHHHHNDEENNVLIPNLEAQQTK